MNLRNEHVEHVRERRAFRADVRADSRMARLGVRDDKCRCLREAVSNHSEAWTRPAPTLGFPLRADMLSVFCVPLRRMGFRGSRVRIQPPRLKQLLNCRSHSSWCPLRCPFVSAKSGNWGREDRQIARAARGKTTSRRFPHPLSHRLTSGRSARRHGTGLCPFVCPLDRVNSDIKSGGVRRIALDATMKSDMMPSFSLGLQTPGKLVYVHSVSWVRIPPRPLSHNNLWKWKGPRSGPFVVETTIRRQGRRLRQDLATMPP